MNKKNTFVGTALIGAMLGLAPLAHADDGKGFGGTVACGGNYLNRLGGTEAHRSTYVIRNLNPSEDVTIERIRFFKADGTLAYDTDASGFPTAVNFVLSAGDQVLNPLQSAQYSLDGWLGATLATEERPGTTLIDWSAASRATPPAVTYVRLIRERNPANGSLRAERSRAHVTCRDLDVDRGARSERGSN